MELNKAKQQLKETDHAISAQQQELDKLNQIINEADEERVRQKKEYDLVMNERDILGMLLPTFLTPSIGCRRCADHTAYRHSVLHALQAPCTPITLMTGHQGEEYIAVLRMPLDWTPNMG